MARQTRGTRKKPAENPKDTATSGKPARARATAAKRAANAAAALPGAGPDPTAEAAPADPPQDIPQGLGHADQPAAARKLAHNIERIEQLGHRLMNALAERALPNPGIEAPGAELYAAAAEGFMKTLSEQPSRMIEMQVSYWGETLANYARAQQALAQGTWTAPEDDAPADKRFSNPLWQSHPYFNLVKRQYHTNSRALKDAAAGLNLTDAIARKRISWLTDQIVDMMAPTNFLATNPDALERAVETEGESLVRGLENLVRDVEQHGGEMVVSLADRKAFAVGENIGTTPGRVVHRTGLFELIHYAPMTDKVHKLPLIVFPPWINKFYILDLKPQNSLIRWLLEQGHSLFVVSWKNPDASFAETGIEDYMRAYLEAMDKVRDLTGERQLNAVGYCIAGTTLSLVLAWLAQQGDDRVNAATLFTTLTDFSDQGEFVNFLQNDFVDGIWQEIQTHGLMRAGLMSRTMSFLRANDLVWGPAIRSYMMGETPPAFDLLFWNGDSTNLPGKMAIQYLRGLCQRNEFADQGFAMMGKTLRLSDIQLPICSVACEGDHIAPWKDCWRGFAGMGSADKTFILSQSGHVAGIVNPPTRKKYGHYAGEGGFDGDSQNWRESASFHEGSWWPLWGEWLAAKAGPLVSARQPEDGLEAAPGRYVHERAG